MSASGGYEHVRLRISGFNRIEELDVVDDLATALRATGKTASDLVRTVIPRMTGYVNADGHLDRSLGNWFLLVFEVTGGRVVVAVPHDLSRNVSPVVFRGSKAITNMQVVALITRMIAML